MTIPVFLGLFSGVAFGFVIQRAGATNPDKMARAHLMQEPDIPRFMLMAVLLSALGLSGMVLSGVGITRILPVSLVATGLAGILFGAGWGLCGYCPGTTWAAVGEGRMDAIFALLGGLVGTALFSHFHEALIPLLYAPTNLGKLTLAGLLGSRWAGTLVLAVGLAGAIWLIGRLWGKTPHD